MMMFVYVSEVDVIPEVRVVGMDEDGWII